MISHVREGHLQRAAIEPAKVPVRAPDRPKPSGGSQFICDGSFGAAKHAGSGVTAALLRQHGIGIFADGQIEALERRLTSPLKPR